MHPPNGVRLRVLVVDDEPTYAELVVAELRHVGFAVEWEIVESEEAYLDALARSPDLVLSDYALPRLGGERALELLRQHGPEIPFISVTGTIGEDATVTLMSGGAVDYLMKDGPADLGPSVARCLTVWQLRREQRESKKEYRDLFEQVPIGLYRATPDGRIVDANAALCEMLGYPDRESILGVNAGDRYADSADGARWLAQIELAGVVLGHETRMTRRDGAVIWTRDTARAVRGDDGATAYYDGAMEDITPRKEAEAALQRQLSRLASLRTVDLAITGSLDARVTLSVLLDQVTMQLGADGADILLFEPESATLTRTAARGLVAGGHSANGWTAGPVAPGLAARAAAGSRLVTIGDVATDPDARIDQAALQAYGVAAYFAMPLLAKGQVKGVLEVLHRRPFLPDEEWREFLEALAAQAAIAIDNAVLFGDLQRSNAELVRAYDTTLEGWARALDLRDKETEGHTQRVTELAVRLARAVGLAGAELVHFRRGALLHDVGKIGIPDAILSKQGRLSEEERAVMRLHPKYADDLLAPIEYLRPARAIPYCHHEKWDGTGYPRGLRGEEIPLAARIFAIVDVWDALLSDRPYRRRWPIERVRRYIAARAGSHFDPAIADVALRLLPHDA